MKFELPLSQLPGCQAIATQSYASAETKNGIECGNPAIRMTRRVLGLILRLIGVARSFRESC